MRLGGHIARFLLVWAAASGTACGKSSPPTQEGLMVVVGTDLKTSEYDEIRVEVSQELTPGGQWHSWLDLSKLVPSEVRLPTTVFIQTGRSADQDVDVRVTAYLSGAPIVLREAQLQAPTDRVATLDFVLAEVCKGQVRGTGAEGEPESACPTGQSCQPATGTCGSNVIPTSSLPTFVPGQSLDAGLSSADAPFEATTTPDATIEAGCSLGTLSCNGQQPQTCQADGTWLSKGSPCTGQACVVGGCMGVCGPGATQCTSASQVETCELNGQWGAAVACAPSQSCVNGSCAEITSCASGGPGLTNCGASGESCCASLEVAGGTYNRTYANPGDGGTDEADPATVSGLRLDKYEVTVGRFRQFVNAWNGGAGYTPPAASGIHSHLNGGNGLNAPGGGYEPGWVASDDSNIAPTDTNIAACGGNTTYVTWTPSVANNETLPINCVNWYESYAFCIWDGGFLPSEAEWEYTGAAGNQQRAYPWGSTDPGTASQYAIYDCYYPSGVGGAGTCTGVSNLAPVGTASLGAGLWGQLDLAGNVWEWNVDWYGTYPDPCTDCAYLMTAANRVVRGGDFNFDGAVSSLPPPYRGSDAPALRRYFIGIRCARAP